MSDLIQQLQQQLPISDPVLIFAIVMIIILVAPIAVQRFKIPGLVGTILAGTIVGPSVLGLLERDDTIILLGTVGLLYLMFMAGLSIDLNKFEKNRNKSIVFGLISFFLPQLASIPMGMYILGFSLESSLLLGSIVGSHTLLAYPIANRIGITKNTAVTMAMGGSIVTDTLSLMILAIVANTIAESSGYTFWITFIILVVGYVFVVIFGLPILGRWFFKNVKNQTNTEYVFMIALLFIAAFLADVVGLAPIIGAFLAGLTLNRLVPESGTLMSRIQFVGNALFIPFFLISVGMLVDVSVMAESLDVWIQTAVFSFLVIFGKSLAAKITQLIFKMTSDEGWTIAGLTIPQAAATLAVTLVGFEIGLLSQTSVNAVVLMILITCLVGPAMVEKFGRNVALKDASAPYNPLDAPERILVPLANPQTAESLVDIALMIKQRKSTEPLFPLTVARDNENVDAQVAEGEKILSHAVVHAAAAEVGVLPVTRVDMNVTNGIVRAVKELRISHIVIGWNGFISARQRIFGTVLDQLLEQAQQLIVVAKLDRPLNITKRVFLLIPPYLDRESGFLGALLTSKNLINEIGAEAVVVTSRNNSSTVKKLIQTKEPAIDSEFIVLESWKGLLGDSRLDLKEAEDLILLMSTRQGTVSWDASLERLPRIIVQNYPSINFLTMYPSEITGNDDPGTMHRISFDRMGPIPAVKTEHVHFNLDEMDAETALKELMMKKFTSNPIELTELTKQVLAQDIDNLPGELPGVVITKTRSATINEPTLFLGISRKGINYPGAEEKIHLIFVLISPFTIGTQRNLSVLASLARILGYNKAYKKLMKAENISDITSILKEVRREIEARA
ncbi:MAG: cation:proton antiporter [Balneolales bacterium]|nr:cation:proton antiporter [Balneolales bacterium]